MEVRVADAQTTTALEQDGSLRCVLKIKYKHSNRHSTSAIAWAKRKADEVSRGLLKGAGLEAEADGLTVCVNMVDLGEHHRSSYLCYDLYLERCTSEARDRIDRSTRQPIHMISKRGDVLIARRAPRMDSIVAEKYEETQQIDRGPRPYFRDSADPPIYDSQTRERLEAAPGEPPLGSYQNGVYTIRSFYYWKKRDADNGESGVAEEARLDNDSEEEEDSDARKVETED